VADQWFDQDYVRLRFGEGLTDALTTRLGGDIDAWCQNATTAVQKELRNKGYTAPATTTDERLLFAAFGAFWELVSSNPKASLKLPDGWADNPFKLALEGIRDGSTDLSDVLTVSTSRSIGGSQWTDTSATATTPRRTSDDELAGF